MVFFSDCEVLHILLLWAVEAVKHEVSCLNDANMKAMAIVAVTSENLPVEHSSSVCKPEPGYLLLLCLCFSFRQSQKWLWMQSSWMSIKTAMV